VSCSSRCCRSSSCANVTCEKPPRFAHGARRVRRDRNRDQRGLRRAGAPGAKLFARWGTSRRARSTWWPQSASCFVDEIVAARIPPSRLALRCLSTARDVIEDQRPFTRAGAGYVARSSARR
jgi:hypothetical protein